MLLQCHTTHPSRVSPSKVSLKLKTNIGIRHSIFYIGSRNKTLTVQKEIALDGFLPDTTTNYYMARCSESRAQGYTRYYSIISRDVEVLDFISPYWINNRSVSDSSLNNMHEMYDKWTKRRVWQIQNIIMKGTLIK